MNLGPEASFVVGVVVGMIVGMVLLLSIIDEKQREARKDQIDADILRYFEANDTGKEND